MAHPKQDLFRFFLLSILLIVLGALKTHAQLRTEEFPRDQEGFLEEIRDMMMDVRRSEAKDFFDEEFIPVWNSEEITPGQREKVYDITNKMLEERLRPYPHFESFLVSFKSFVEGGRSSETFDKWILSLEKLLGGRNKRKFDEYLSMSAHLFSDNILYKSRSTTWQANTPNFQFKFEDEEPFIDFPSLNLICYAKGDSSVIFNTKGTYYPLEEEWRGYGGKVTWLRAGFDSSETYAVINNYNIRMHSPSFDADSVKFFHPFFDKPLLGDLTEKVLASRTGNKALFPQFDSYDKRLFIKDLAKNVDYSGGLSMSGANLIGSGTDKKPAIFRFYREGHLQFEAKGLNYTISPERITSQKVQATFYLEKDSISHPQLIFKFSRKDRTLSLIRKDEGLYKTPYYNTYHELDMYFEALYWTIDDPLVEMGTLRGSSEHNAAFESSDYFRERRYDAFQGMANIHPFIKIRRMAEKVGTRQFHVEELADHMRLPVRQVTPLVLNLSTKGFLIYNTETGIVQVKQKLYDYILAKSEKKDYDVLLFNSTSDNYVNATLSLLDHSLDLKGVSRVDLSDVQRVSVFPKDGKVTLKKNRDFDFSGVLRAGKLNFYGKKYDFEYDEFEVNLQEVDSLTMYARQLDDGDGDTSMMLVKSTVEDIAGKVHVDSPDNKSGYKSRLYPKFPIFKCSQKSYVYYDDNHIHDGVYDRGRFYFQLEPFKMDSLDNYDNNALAFDGTFSSGGIMPDFEETLTLQHDHSLGFEREAPEGGFPLYSGTAHFDDKIKLSNDGLQGDGTIEFLTSSSRSEEFTFFPDSTTGIAQQFTNKAKDGDPGVPVVMAEEVDFKFLPEDDKLAIRKRQQAIKMYQDEVDLHGGLALTQSGMTGDGTMNFENAKLTSRNYRFNRMTTDADTASFNLSSLDADALAFKTDNVSAHVDFENRKAEFKSNSEETFVEFPANEYICYMDQFNWFMDANDVELEASEDVQDININTDLDLSRSNFYSVHPDQDSLNFMAPKARYDIGDKLITCREVPYIPVADARVEPDSNIVRIEKNAEMRTLENATILANSITKYHTIFDATVDIFERNDYSGSGKYHYIDENKTKQVIHFGTVAVDTTNQTYAEGKVLEKDDFTLSPNFKYKGEVRLEASRKNLLFGGEVQIIHECENLDRNWMSFESEIDPNNIFIPVDSNNTGPKSEIANGIVLSEDPVKLYSTFLSKKEKVQDIHVLNAKGFLTFNKREQQYRISNKEKLKNRLLPGNYVSIDKKTCKVEGDGRIDLGVNLGQVETTPVGNIEHDVVRDSFAMSMALPMDFFMNDKALEEMADKVNEHPDIQSFDLSSKVYEKALRQSIGMEKTDKMISDLTLKGKIRRFPDQLEKSLYLADVDFVWNEETSSYESVGKIGIANILDEQVYKNVNGHIRITKKRTGDAITVYLELDEDTWYYFDYKRNLMQTISSDSEFNTVIKETKKSKRKYDNAKEEAPYQYMLSSKRKKIQFVSQFE